MPQKKEYVHHPSESEENPPPPAEKQNIPTGKKSKEDLNKLLDEIDDVLEENAEEFVRSYVQRGGE